MLWHSGHSNLTPDSERSKWFSGVVTYTCLTFETLVPEQLVHFSLFHFCWVNELLQYIVYFHGNTWVYCAFLVHWKLTVKSSKDMDLWYQGVLTKQQCVNNGHLMKHLHPYTSFKSKCLPVKAMFQPPRLIWPLWLEGSDNMDHVSCYYTSGHQSSHQVDTIQLLRTTATDRMMIDGLWWMGEHPANMCSPASPSTRPGSHGGTPETHLRTKEQ